MNESVKFFKESKQEFSVTLEAAKRLKAMVSSIPSIKEVLIVDLTVPQPDLSDEAGSYVEELRDTHEAIICDERNGLYHSCYPVFTDEGDLTSCIYIEGVDPTELEGLDTLVEIFSGCLSSLQSVEKAQFNELQQHNKMVNQFNNSLLTLQNEADQQREMLNNLNNTISECHSEITRWKCCFTFNNTMYKYNSVDEIDSHLQTLLLDIFYTDHVQIFNQSSKSNIIISDEYLSKLYDQVSRTNDILINTNEVHRYHTVIFIPININNMINIIICMGWTNNNIFINAVEDIRNTIIITYNRAFKFMELHNMINDTNQKTDEVIKNTENIHINLFTEQKRKDLTIKLLLTLFKSTTDYNLLCNMIHKELPPLIDLEWITIWILDNKNEKIFTYVRGNCYKFNKNDGIIGKCLLNNTVINVLNVLQDVRYNMNIDGIQKIPTQSLLCVPIYSSKGKMIGGLECGSNNITSQHEELFKQYCGYISPILSLCSKYNKMVKKTQECEQNIVKLKQDITSGIMKVYEITSHSISIQNLIEVVVNQCSNLLGMSSMTLFSLTTDKQSLVTYIRNRKIRFKPNKGLTGLTYSTGRFVVITELCEDKRYDPQYDILYNPLLCHSVLSVPLHDNKGNINGILLFGNNEKEYFNGNNEVYLTIANHIGSCLEKCQIINESHTEITTLNNTLNDKESLINKLQKEVNEHSNDEILKQTSIKTVNSLLSLQDGFLSSNKIETLMSIVYNDLKELLNCESSSLYICDKKGTYLWTEDIANGKIIKHPINRGIFQYMLNHGGTTIFDDPFNDIRCDKTIDTGRNIICATIKSENGNLIGIVKCENKLSNNNINNNNESINENDNTLGKFNMNDNTILTLCAGEISIIMQRIRHNNNKDYNKINQEYEMNKVKDEKTINYLKRLNIFYSSLLSIHTMADLYPTFERELSKVMDCEECCLLLIENNNYNEISTKRGVISSGRGFIYNIIESSKPKIISKCDDLTPFINELSVIIPISSTYYRNIIGLPLFDVYNKIKVIIIGVNKTDGGFTNDDQILLGQLQEPILTIIKRIQLFNEKMKRDIEIQLNEHTTQAQMILNKLNEKENDQIKLYEQLKLTEDKYKELQNNHEKAIIQLRNDLKRAKTDKMNLKGLNKEAQKLAENAVEALQKMKQENEDQEKEKELIIRKYKESKRQLEDNYNNKLIQLQISEKNLLDQKNELEKQCNQLSEMIKIKEDEYKKVMISLQCENNELHNKLEKVTGVTETLENETKKKKEMLEEATKKLNKTEKMLNHINNEYNNMKIIHNQQQEQLYKEKQVELNEHKDKLDSAYNKLKEDYKKVWSEREKLAKERSKAELENRRLKATLNKIKEIDSQPIPNCASGPITVK